MFTSPSNSHMVLDSQDGQHPSGLSFKHLETGMGAPESSSSSNTTFTAPAVRHLTSLPTPRLWSHSSSFCSWAHHSVTYSALPCSCMLAFSHDPHFCIPVHSSIADDNTSSAILATPFIKPLHYNLFCAATWVIGEPDEI